MEAAGIACSESVGIAGDMGHYAQMQHLQTRLS